ncbi:hypothetical protein L7F22_062813 [Adiantum nelumboides]|nr:hypothetical protein [Adiantum nelumboides]
MVDVATYGLQVISKAKEEDAKTYGEIWPYALKLTERDKVSRGKLCEARNCICETTGWYDPVDLLSVYAYIAKSKANEAWVEEKKKRDEEIARSSKRATRSSNKKEEVPKPSPEVNLEDAPKDKKQEEDEEAIPRSHFTRTHWARATTKTIVKLGYMDEPMLALVDHGLEINLLSKSLHQKGRWLIVDVDHGWQIQAANMLPGDLYGACANVKVAIGDVCDEHKFFIQEHSSYPIILGQPYITAVRMETKVLDDGLAYARVQSRGCAKDMKVVSRRQVSTGFSQSAMFLHKETFFAGFLGLTSEGSLSYKKFNELPKWEKQYVIGIQSDLQGCNVLESDEVISGIFEEVYYVDVMSELDEINHNRLQSETDFVKLHSIEVYEMLLQLNQGFEEMIKVQVEMKYKKVAKKVKQVATPLLEGNNELIEEAS